jgi:hypothetical protein
VAVGAAGVDARAALPVQLLLELQNSVRLVYSRPTLNSPANTTPETKISKPTISRPALDLFFGFASFDIALLSS